MTINGRTLTKITCKCGRKGEMWLKPGQAHQCLECQENADRAKNGWNPANSRD